MKKVFAERKARFLPTERSGGWHLQYDGIVSEAHPFIKDPRLLMPFDLDRARFDLMLPSNLIGNFQDELKRTYAELQGLQKHASELSAHAANLEKEREELKRHAANLEAERADLRKHVINLETESSGLRRHATNLESAHKELSRNVANVTTERQQVAQRADALEQSCLQLEERKHSLERELTAIHKSLVWRSTSVLRGFFNKPDKDPKPDENQRPPSRSEAIFSSLDVPGETQTTVAKTCLLRGWTCSGSGIESMRVLIDGQQFHQFLPDLERPDVALVHPTIAGAGRSGFDTDIPLALLSPGVHDLELVIRDGAGNELRHHRSLVVDANPYHRVLIEKQLRAHERDMLRETIAATGRSPRFELWIDDRAGDGVIQTLHSIAAQTYLNYACHIVETADAIRSVAAGSLLEEVQSHTSFAAAMADDAAATDYLAFLLPGERLLPDALIHLAARLAKEPVSLAYSDHDHVERTGAHTDPDYAPDWAPEHLYSRNYVGGVFFARRDEIRKHGLTDEGVAWRYDLLLKITERTKQIIHIAHVLWSSPSFPVTSAAPIKAELHAVEAALARRDADAEVIVLADAPVRRVRRRFDAKPKVSIIVPTTGRSDLLRPLVESLSSKTSYPNYELLFLDNGRGSHMDGIEFLRSKGLRVIERDEPFNWARLNNVGARACDGDLLLFMNDDIEVFEPEWLDELVGQVLTPDVGTVGALLLYPDGRIQHAGVFLVDHGGGFRHYLQNLDPKAGTYQHLDRVVREVTANTGACMMVRRDVFEELGGFDDGFRVAFNDIDFCLRLSERGYRNLWTPHCCLVHHESVSRKGTNVIEDERRVWDHWGARLLAGDAYHNANLAKDRGDCSIDISVLNRTSVVTQEPVEDRGVNLIGDIRAEMGLGEAARGLARAMERTGIPFVVINYEFGIPARKGESTWSRRIVERPVHGINILNVNADLTPEACGRIGSQVFEGRYTIGYWVWELPELPDRWLSSFDHVDEVWVPSEFVREAVARKSNVPVIRIPHAVEKGPGPFLDRPFFDLPEACYLYLSMYDTHSVVERKNPEGAISAFREAFSPGDESVGLVIKINNFDENEEARLRALIGAHHNVYLIKRTLSRHEVDSLLACCDCFVSLHRSEGFGLPIAEAMSLGKPVIATHWSGNVDFMDERCAACVDFQIRQLGRDYGPYDAHQHWAEPSLESAARWMRRLYSEPALARRLGAAGKKKIGESFSDRSVGDLIRARLAQIRA